jgi:hypothetical protein
VANKLRTFHKSRTQSPYSSLVIGRIKPIGGEYLGVGILSLFFIFWFAIDFLGLAWAVWGSVCCLVFSICWAFHASVGLLPAFRLLLLAGPGIIGGVVFWFSGGTFFVTYYSGDWLTDLFVGELAMTSAVAGLASLVGHRIAVRSMPRPMEIPLFRCNLNERNAISWLGLGGAVVMLSILSLGSGEHLFTTGSYGSSGATGGVPLGIGTYNTAGVFCVFVSFLGLHYNKLKMNRVRWSWVIIISFLLFDLMLKGVRQDTIPVLGIMFFVYYLLRKRRVVLKPIVYALFIVLIGWYAALFTGYLRANFGWHTARQLVDKPFDWVFSNTSQGGDFLNLEVASSTTGTFLAVFLKTSGGESKLLWGSSYLDFLLRTPPEILYPDRPKDLSWQMNFQGAWLAGGGILEIAEAYWNFSKLGVLFVPMVISYIITRLSLKICDHPNPLLAAYPLVLLSTMPRWILYQTFSLYKGGLTVVFCAIGLGILTKIVKGAVTTPISQANRKKSEPNSADSILKCTI